MRSFAVNVGPELRRLGLESFDAHLKRVMEAPPKIRFVVATRESRESFFARTAMGKSLSLYECPYVELSLHEKNRTGLPALYNQAIDAARTSPAILVFVHDDVHLCDFYWPHQMLNAVTHFQIVGVAGNKRRVPGQPAWRFVDPDFKRDAPEHLSGLVGHGIGFPPDQLSVYGAPCQEVKLLDGLMLISRSSTLIENDLRFDERFDFHHYDLDFCRQAELKGLKMGTWSLSVIHESLGDFSSEAWKAGYRRYLEKWGD
jgi:hypothetical protein